MRLSVIITVVFLSAYALFSGSAGFARKKPQAYFMDRQSGKIDKLTFIAAKELTLSNNEDSLWKITSYEFNYSCDGQLTLKQFYGAQIDREIIKLVKNCDKTTVADFRFIKAKNSKTGAEIRLNDIELTLEN